MSFFNSPEFIKNLELMTGIRGLQIDAGLHGGGWHGQSAGGKLNVHLDYSIHPKLGLEQRLNLILYITSGWKPEWGGQLGLWSGSRDKMGELGAQVDCLFNRAVLFDTTQNSWHGLPDAIRCPRGVAYKKSRDWAVLRGDASTQDRARSAARWPPEPDDRLLAGQARFWGSFSSGALEIWRSGAIEKKGRRARSVGDRMRTFWRHLKVAARPGNKAAGLDGQPYSQSS